MSSGTRVSATSVSARSTPARRARAASSTAFAPRVEAVETLFALAVRARILAVHVQTNRATVDLRRTHQDQVKQSWIQTRLTNLPCQTEHGLDNAWGHAHEVDSSFHDVFHLHLSRRIRNSPCDTRRRATLEAQTRSGPSATKGCQRLGNGNEIVAVDGMHRCGPFRGDGIRISCRREQPTSNVANGKTRASKDANVLSVGLLRALSSPDIVGHRPARLFHLSISLDSFLSPTDLASPIVRRTSHHQTTSPREAQMRDGS